MAVVIVAMMLLAVSAGTDSRVEPDPAHSLKGPGFTAEPSEMVDFSNETGVKIDCSASGNPDPDISWIFPDGSPVNNVTTVRQVYPNGTLLFFPFSAENYRQDVHAVVYRCVASNVVGTIISRDVKVRGVISRSFSLYVYDAFVIKGSTAVFRCQMPMFLTEYMSVIAWIREDNDTINNSDLLKEDNYVISPSGDLYIRNVSDDLSGSKYSCRIKHKLTGLIKDSSSSGKLIVTEPVSRIPPKIIDNKSDVIVAQGSTAVIPCVVQGYPIPSTEWFMKNQSGHLVTIQLNNRILQARDGLVIKNATTEDVNIYLCVASNTVGKERSATTLNVTAKLHVELSSSSAVLDVGKSLTVKSSVKGYPKPTVFWLKDGKSINDEHVITNGSALTITSMKSSLKGIYQCFAKNELSMISRNFELHLGEIPLEIISAFEEQILQPESDLSLQCVVGGNPIPKITWSLDDVPLSKDIFQNFEGGRIISWLNISKIRIDDGGIYQCKAMNSRGTLEHSARIYVFGPITAVPLWKKAVVAGKDAFIDCPFKGYPFDIITWEKDSVLLPITFQQKVMKNGTLLIQKAERITDDGLYQCNIKDSKGKITKGEVLLSVKVPPEITPFYFREEHAREGASARVLCIVSLGDLPVNLSWFKDDKPIPSVLGVTIQDLDESHSILKIPSVTLNHNGNYSCKASNDAGIAIHTATLSVNVPPRWIQEPEDFVERKNKMLQLPCQADGFPKPTIQWMKVQGNDPNGETLSVTNSENVQIFKNGSLQISKATDFDQGYYFCIVTNGIGKGLSKMIFLKIEAPVSFKEKEISLSVILGKPAALKCEVSGDIPIRFSWLHNNQSLTNSKISRLKIASSSNRTSTLEIQNTVNGDSGIYHCKAENAHGKDVLSINLILKEIPHIPEIITLKAGNRSAELRWEEPFDGHDPILRFHLQYKRKQDSWQSRSISEVFLPSARTATIQQLQPATTYEFRLAAENAIGRSNFSSVRMITLDEEAPEGKPQHVEADASDPHSIRLSWKPPKKSFWNGAIRGYYVGYKVLGSADPFTFTALEVPEDYTEDLIYRLTNLKMYTQYVIIVQAYNNGGRGPSSDEVVMMTSEDTPSKPPEDIRCSPISAHHIYIIWGPPPDDAINGILRGYKVLFRPIDELYDSKERFNVSVSSKITLSGLEAGTNFSIQVLAFTTVGDGVRSDPVFCRTFEDVPEAPADIKALPSSTDSILVSWRKPKKPNGSITKYTVYYKQLEEGEEIDDKLFASKDGADDVQDKQGVHIQTAEPAFHYLEVKHLSPKYRYAVWVSATSAIGEGPRTTNIILSPGGNIIPAKIASFSDNLKIPWKRDVVFDCKAVGSPIIERKWLFRDQAVNEDDRIIIRFDGSLMIKKTEGSHSGNYTCHVENEFGQDEVKYSLLVQVPPSVPLLDVVSKSLTSVRLQWKVSDTGGTPIKGFILSYKREFGQWDKKELPPDTDRYLLDDLACGATYLIYLEAYNSIGTSPPCDIITVTTQGEAFVMPSKEELIREGVTFITVNLDSWPTTGCPVHTFVAEYKQESSTEWTTAAHKFSPLQKKLLISGLEPATWYVMRLTAHTSGESNVGEYVFSTLSPSGVSISTPKGTKEEKIILFSMDPWIFIPLVALIITIIIATAVVCIFLKRKSNTGHQSPDTVTEWTQESTLGRSRPELGVSVESFIHLQRGPASVSRHSTIRRNRDDANPYASVRVPGCYSDDELKHLQQPRQSIPVCVDIPDFNSQWYPSQIVGRDTLTNQQNPYPSWNRRHPSIPETENIYATATRQTGVPIPEINLHNQPTLRVQETTFTFPNSENNLINVIQDHDNSNYEPDKAETLPIHKRQFTTGENAWLLDDKFSQSQK